MKKRDKFVTFAEQDRRAYVKDAFNLLLVIACFICISQALFSVPVPTIFDGFENTSAVVCLRAALSMLYQGVALYAPFLIFAIIKNRSAGRYYSNKQSVATPGYYIFGTLAVTGTGVALYYASTFILSSLRQNGFIVDEPLPLIGNTPVTYGVFILSAIIIPTFFQEITFRGIVLTEIKKDSNTFAVIVGALICSISHLSFLQMPFLFITGLISGWLCLKTKTLWVSFAANGVLNGTLAFLWVLQNSNPQLYGSVFGIVALIGAVIGVVSIIILFLKYGFKVKKPENGFSKKDSLKAFFGSFGLWILIFITVFEVFFTYLKKPKKEDNTETAKIVMYLR